MGRGESRAGTVPHCSRTGLSRFDIRPDIRERFYAILYQARDCDRESGLPLGGHVLDGAGPIPTAARDRGCIGPIFFVGAGGGVDLPAPKDKPKAKIRPKANNERISARTNRLKETGRRGRPPVAPAHKPAEDRLILRGTIPEREPSRDHSRR